MNADAFRQLYKYHFGMNRFVWNNVISPLTDEQFTRETDYSHGSVRNQVVHMMNVDNGWFDNLIGVEVEHVTDPLAYTSRDEIRQQWDRVEAQMRAYLETITDDMLFTWPSERDPMMLWQILFHIVNHGTDHRAQLLALVNQLGGDTYAQDYVYFIGASS